MTDGTKDSGSDKKQDPVDTSLTSGEEVAFDPNGKGLYGKTQAGQDEIQKDVDQTAKAVKDAFDKNENPGEALSRKVHDEMGSHFGKTGYLNMYEQMLNQALKDKKSEIGNPSFPDLSIHFDKGHGYATITDSSKNEPIKIAANISSDTDSKAPVIQIGKSSPEDKQTMPLAGVPIAHNFKLDNQQSDIHPPQQPIAHQDKGMPKADTSADSKSKLDNKQRDIHPPQHPVDHQVDSSVQSSKKGSGAPIHEEAAQIIKGLSVDQIKQKSEEFLKSSDSAKAQAQALQPELDKLNQSGYRMIDISKDPNKPNLVTEAKLLNIPDDSLSEANKRIKQSLRDDLLNVSDASVEDWPALKEHRQVLLASIKLENDLQSTLAKSDHDQKLAGILQQLATANQNVHDLHLQKPNRNKDTAVHPAGKAEMNFPEKEVPNSNHHTHTDSVPPSGKIKHKQIDDLLKSRGISPNDYSHSAYNQLSAIFEKGSPAEKLEAFEAIKQRAFQKKNLADSLPSQDPSIDSFVFDAGKDKKTVLLNESIDMLNLACDVHHFCPKATIADHKELTDLLDQWKKDAKDISSQKETSFDKTKTPEQNLISNFTDKLKTTTQALKNLSPEQISVIAESLNHQSEMTNQGIDNSREKIAARKSANIEPELNPIMQELTRTSQQAELLGQQVKQMLKINLNDAPNDIKHKLQNLPPEQIAQQIALLKLAATMENVKGEAYVTLIGCKAEIGGKYLDRADIAVKTSGYFGNSVKYAGQSLQCSEEYWHLKRPGLIFEEQDRENNKNQLEQLITEAKQDQNTWLEASKKYSTSARVLGELPPKQQ